MINMVTVARYQSMLGCQTPGSIGEMADERLVFQVEGCSAEFQGFLIADSRVGPRGPTLRVAWRRCFGFHVDLQCLSLRRCLTILAIPGRKQIRKQEFIIGRSLYH